LAILVAIHQQDGGVLVNPKSFEDNDEVVVIADRELTLYNAGHSAAARNFKKPR